ncbi:TorF family putative porin [Pseudoalteromonas gelatinilytica]|uniref:TIGR02001 family outer membrane protein n=1 Tax=Pseudoalteromonas gelatinilytica TaxID=1703256 RepID=A0ABQ1T7B5_9GAMM|nr:TorF family putative porin [Pseudoalteromonas profundi]GGE83388.1 TIGR02001 family outer membrane protein [Pseudoalteromonas profundi]
MTTRQTVLAAALPLALLSTSAMADLSTTVTLASDYTFNGVSQTMNDPAIQGSLDYAFADSGMYVGTWASNVDFGDGTDIEWDAYFGNYAELTDALSVDYGIAYYSYHGEDYSSDGNYPEVYSKFGYDSSIGQVEFNLWYSWDYFGTGAGHLIYMVAHTFEVAPNHAFRASFDVSNSLDGDKFSWDGSDKSYKHYRLAYQTSYAGFDIEIAGENTSIDSEYADERIVASISRSFDL